MMKHDVSFQKEVKRESVKIEITEKILTYMEEVGLKKKKLAENMGITSARLSTIFRSNIKMNTLADMLFALDLDMEVVLRPSADKKKNRPMPNQEERIEKLEARIEELESLVKDILGYKEQLHEADALYHLNRIGDMASDIRQLEQEASSLKHDVERLERDAYGWYK